MNAKVSRHFCTLIGHGFVRVISWNFNLWENLISIFLSVQLSLSVRFWHDSSLFVAHNAIFQNIISNRFCVLTRLYRIHFRSVHIEIIVSGRWLISENHFSILLIRTWSTFVEAKEYFLRLSSILFVIRLTHIFNFASWPLVTCDRCLSTATSNITHGGVELVI